MCGPVCQALSGFGRVVLFQGAAGGGSAQGGVRAAVDEFQTVAAFDQAAFHGPLPVDLEVVVA